MVCRTHWRAVHTETHSGGTNIMRFIFRVGLKETLTFYIATLCSGSYESPSTSVSMSSGCTRQGGFLLYKPVPFQDVRGWLPSHHQKWLVKTWQLFIKWKVQVAAYSWLEHMQQPLRTWKICLQNSSKKYFAIFARAHLEVLNYTEL